MKTSVILIYMFILILI